MQHLYTRERECVLRGLNTWYRLGGCTRRLQEQHSRHGRPDWLTVTHDKEHSDSWCLSQTHCVLSQVEEYSNYLVASFLSSNVLRWKSNTFARARVCVCVCVCTRIQEMHPEQASNFSGTSGGQQIYKIKRCPPCAAPNKVKVTKSLEPRRLALSLAVHWAARDPAPHSTFKILTKPSHSHININLSVSRCHNS